jgi:acetoin utilization deacetylase AcuC-like enzyme
MKIITDERCTRYRAIGHPERPARIKSTVALLESQKDVPVDWVTPGEVDDEDILRAHTPAHVDLVRKPTGPFDGDTPAYDDIHGHARRSVGAAIQAVELARAGETVFSLMRPPGHHATRSRAMGFCYFNSVAIAVLKAQASGSEKVAVFDFDVHHGNGTENILLNRPDTYFHSIHQHPCYPGTGTENVGSNCFNYPVPPEYPRAEYRQVLRRALDQLALQKPDFLAVSAGFDAYARDPLAQETLEAEDFHWLGESIRKLGITTISLLEGGYSDDLPELILAYLKGLTGKQ